MEKSDVSIIPPQTETTQLETVQGAMLQETGSHLVEAIRQLRVDGPLVRVADFGSSGVGSSRGCESASEFPRQGRRRRLSRDFQYFFSNLPFNDFSSLFREPSRKDGKGKPPYLAAAVGEN